VTDRPQPGEGVVAEPLPPAGERPPAVPPGPPIVPGPPAAAEQPATPPPDRPRSLWRELPVLIVVAVGLALLIKTFFLQAFFIPSGSMEQTLAIGDRVLVNKLVYDIRTPHRGEIVVFNGKNTSFPKEISIAPASNPVAGALRSVQTFLGLGSFDESDFIKRIIAVGGDTVSCPPDAANPGRCGHVVVNGKALDESAYLYDDNHQPFTEHKIPAGMLWVMGDHRGNSQDSRDHGPIPASAVVGRAFVTVWPVGRFSGHPVPGTFDQPLTSASRPPLALSLTSGAALPPVAGLVLAAPVIAVRRRRASRGRGLRAAARG